MVTERSCNTLSPLQAMISSTQNYYVYRETIRAAVPPCIPFLGSRRFPKFCIGFTDMIYIDQAFS